MDRTPVAAARDGAPRPPSGGAPGAEAAPPRPVLSAAEARRALVARARRDPAWLIVAVALGGVAGVLAIPQAEQLTAVLDGAFLRSATPAELRGPLLALLLVALTRALALALGGAAGQRAGARLATALRREVTARLLALGPSYLERRRSGEVGTEVLDGIDRIPPFVARFLPQAALTVAVPAVLALAVLRLDPLSGVILLVTGPLIPLFMVLLGGLAEQRAQRQWRALGLLSAQALETLQGLETLSLFGRARDHAAAMERSGERYRRTTLDVLKVAFLSGFALELLAMLGTAMVAVTVGVRLATGALPFPVALTTLLLAPEFYLPFRQLGAHHHAAMEGVAAARDVLAGLEPTAAEPARAPEAAPPAPRPTPTGHDAPRVRLRGLAARYPGARTDALRGVDLELEPAGLTALVGPTGAGKSSLVRVLIGTLAVERGGVWVDGVRVDPARAPEWRARLALVPQHPHLFAGTVLDNLRLGRPEASPAEVEEAAREAGADGFIRSLPEGYATVLGEDGLDLSGGERQRLAIARALVRHADVVLLDEISAHLDAVTEAALELAVARLARSRTVLVVAHRLATVRRADRIAVMAAGRVVEQGTHAALAAAGGAYARLLHAASDAPGGPGPIGGAA